LIVDFVRESRYWFSNRGGTDYKYVITFADVSDEPDIQNRLDTIEHELAALHTGINNFDRRVERAAAEAATGGRELGSLRDALNDTVWRTERSYIELSEVTADQAQRFRESLERAHELVSQTNAATIALGSKLEKLREKLRTDLEAAVTRSAGKEAALAGQLEQLRVEISGFIQSWRRFETETKKPPGKMRAAQTKSAPTP
jgi:chromosome segregation ATPase